MSDTRVNRAGFLQRLEAVRPGLSPAEETEQSAMFAFRQGRVLTFDGHVHCRIKSMLPKDLTAAVPAARLLESLARLKEEEIDVETGGGVFTVRGLGKRKVEMSMAAEVTMPVDAVEPPGDWSDLPEDFLDAVGRVVPCAERCGRRPSLKSGLNKTLCVHLTPDYLEATDCLTLCRYRLATGVARPFLVIAENLKHAVPLGVTRVSETKEWLHFGNPSGLVYSCRRFDGDFPDFGAVYAARGKAVTLPKGLKEAAGLGGVFSGEIKDNDVVNVTLTRGRVVVVGQGVTGRATDPRDVNYAGPPMEFSINPETLAKIAEDHSDVEITDKGMRIDGGRWVMVVHLKTPVPTSNGDGHD